MSDSEYGKKLHEDEDLAAFIIAYQGVTGEELQVADSGERPDYLCTRPNGQRVGVELTKVYASTYNERKFAEYRELLGRGPITGYDIALKIDASAFHKSEKVRGGGWRFKRNLLVLQVYERPLDEVSPWLDEFADEITSGSAFQQVWVAGLYEEDAYSEIDLYCIKPTRLRGFYPRPFEKPYG